MVGAAVLLLSTGLGGLRTAVLPKWLAIVTIVLGVCALLGPTGFLVWFAMPVWCIVVGVVLMRRQSADRSSPRGRRPASPEQLLRSPVRSPRSDRAPRAA